MPWFKMVFHKEQWDNKLMHSVTVKESVLYYELESLKVARMEAHDIYDACFDGGIGGPTLEVAWAIYSVEETSEEEAKAHDGLPRH